MNQPVNLGKLQYTRWIEKIQRDYSTEYASLNWVTEEQALHAMKKRRALLTELKNQAVSTCKSTKVDGSNLSPGCKICAQGDWSCLFINGRCNCRCFYCPAPQDVDIQPTTNTVTFPQPNDYLDYIETLGFAGVSLSGGEPFLTFEKTLQFLQAVQSRFGDSIHTWLYTNGTLATPDKLNQLKKAGLKEIRFDIGATRMKLEAAKQAVDIIDTVTVEIPAIPEEFETMKQTIREMAAAGINHLNLHQLRLTPHNLPHLARRNYTFLHGERATVLESELTALQLIHWAYKQEIKLPINYCSFVYKNRFQRAAARRKSAAFVKKPHENVTENGYIRLLELEGPPEDVSALVDRLQQHEKDNALWALFPRQNRLCLHASLWSLIDFPRFRAFVSYAEAKILDAVTYRNYFVELPINPSRNLFVEKAHVTEKIQLDTKTAEKLRAFTLSGNAPKTNNFSHPTWQRLQEFETIQEGLQDYY
ncbi:radical SAM protein [bacterium]|nr:radical SAM protein [bacterium]